MVAADVLETVVEPPPVPRTPVRPGDDLDVRATSPVLAAAALGVRMCLLLRRRTARP